MIDGRRCVGGVLLVCGLTVLVGASGAFDYQMADRTATVSVADDPNAYLGIVDNSAADGANVDGKTDSGNAYYLDDNADAFVDASAFSSRVVRIDYDDGTIDTDPGLAATVQNTDVLESSTTRDYVLQLECEDGTADQGTGYVTVAVTADGDDFVDVERTTDEPINIDCT